jgi:hypothetical protein
MAAHSKRKNKDAPRVGPQSEIAKKIRGREIFRPPLQGGLACWHAFPGFHPGLFSYPPYGRFPTDRICRFSDERPGAKAHVFCRRGFRGLKAPVPSVLVYGPEGSCSLRWKLFQERMRADLTPARKG